jgi:hypothetical protein
MQIKLLLPGNCESQTKRNVQRLRQHRGFDAIQRQAYRAVQLRIGA